MRFYGVDIDPSVGLDYHKRLQELGVGTRDSAHHVGPLFDGHIHEPMKGLDVVCLCVPGSQQEASIAAIAPYLKEGTILFDVCSAKAASIVRISRAITALSLPFKVDYVPFHILNGFAGAGPMSAKEGILDAPGVIVPNVSSPKAESFIESLLVSAGTRVFKIPAAPHDEALATTSQHEYLAMFAFADCTFIKRAPLGSVDPGRWIQSQLRIIDASPEMWAANFTDCRGWILKSSARFSALLEGIGTRLHKIDDRIDAAHDFVKLMPSRNITAFNLCPYDGHKLQASAFSAVLSLALTENIMRMSERTGIFLPDKINPSARDGMGPMNDPTTAKFLIREYIETLPCMIGEYQARYGKGVRLIANLPPYPERNGSTIVDPRYDAVKNYVRSFAPIDKYIKMAMSERRALGWKRALFAPTNGANI